MYINLLKDKLINTQCDLESKIVEYPDFIKKMKDILLELRVNKKMLYFIGNGGSAGISIHMTADYLKNGKMKTHSMHDPSVLTCLGNDFGYEYVFQKQIEIVSEANDILVAISSSGNSVNIVKGIEAARRKKCKIFTLSGFSCDNSIRKMGDFNLYVPCAEYGIVESIHNLALQHIVDEIFYFDEGKILEEIK